MKNKPGRRTSGSSKSAGTVTFLAGIVFAGCLIQLAGMAKADAVVFPGVREILCTFFRLLGTPKTWLLAATSLWHLAVSLVLASVFGIALGLLEGFSAFWQKFLSPLMILLRSLPMIVLVVVLMVLLDYALVPVMACSLVLIPLISEACAEGVRSIDSELIDVYRLNGGFSLRVLFSVYLPLMAPFLRQAFVNAVGMGMKIIVSAEYLVQSRNSLGKAVFSSAYFTEYAEIYAYALIMMLLVLAVSGLARMGERLHPHNP